MGMLLEERGEQNVPLTNLYNRKALLDQEPVLFMPTASIISVLNVLKHLVIVGQSPFQ